MKFHSLVDVITNSSSELFSVLKPGSISEARRIMESVGLDDVFSIHAVVAFGWGDGNERRICNTDEELDEALKEMKDVGYPKECDLHIILKRNGQDIDLAQLLSGMKESNYYMQ